MHNNGPETVLFQDRQRDTFACLLILTIICGFLFFLKTSSLPLADSEESREALVVQDMLGSSTLAGWFMPRLEGAVFDKPALFFWLAAAGQYLTGDLEAGGRLVSGLSALLAVLIAFSLGHHLKGNFTGLVSGLVLATSPEFFFLARWYRMEMLFVLLMWAALWWFWRYESADNPAPNRYRWLGFYAFCALASLVKGPTGLALPVFVVGSYLLIVRRWRGVMEMFSLWGIGAYLLIAGLWYIPAAIIYPDWTYRFLVLHNLSRYAGYGFGRHGLHGGGPFTYVPFLLAGLLPWTCFLFMAAERSFPRLWRTRIFNKDYLFLWLAALIPFLFFSFSGIKLSSYILPVFPPLSVLIACVISEWVGLAASDRHYLDGTLILRVFIAVMFGGIIGIEAYMGWLNRSIVFLFLAAGCWLWMMSFALRLARRRLFIGSAVAAVISILSFSISHTGPAAYEYMSCHEFGKTVRNRITDNSVLCYWDDRMYAFPLYAGRTSGVKIDDKDPADMKKLADLMYSGKTVYCIVPEIKMKEFEAFRKIYAGSLDIIFNNGRFFVFSNASGRTART